MELVGYPRQFDGEYSADTFVDFYFGGLLLFIGGVGEWILGNNFPATVFTTFGAFVSLSKPVI
jgi:succinate-acetate transporter protein